MRSWLLTCALLVCATSLAAAPRWVTTYGADTDYDPVTYLTGYGVSPVAGKTAEGLQASRDQALKNLGQKLKVSIEASSRLTDSQFGDQNFSSYQSDVKTMVSLDLGGVEKYESAFDADQGRYVALAVLNRSVMRESLATRRTAQIARLDGDLKEVRDLATRKRLDLLQESLKTFEAHLDDLVQNVALARLLGDSLDAQSTLGRFYSSKEQVRSSLLAEKILTQRDLVAVLVRDLPWKTLAGKSIVLVPAVYKTTDISGQFFSYLRDDLSDAVRQAYPGTRVSLGDPDQRPDYVFKGSYYEAGKGWHVVFRLTDMATGDLVATWDGDLDAAFVQAQKFEFLPENMVFAAADHDRQVAVFDNPVATELRVWTNKGSEGVVFQEDEKMNFYVQSNRPGFISILYHLAGKQRIRTPLVENYRIAADQIYQPVKIDVEFEVTPPFGSESAQVFFSPDKMPAFQTKTTLIDGQEYDVLTDDYDGLLVKTRGLSKAKKTSNADALKTDVSLTLTTVAKR